MTHEQNALVETAAEQIALILLKLGNEEMIEAAGCESQEMAVRAFRGWWMIAGRPSFNARMRRLRRRANL